MCACVCVRVHVCVCMCACACVRECERTWPVLGHAYLAPDLLHCCSGYAIFHASGLVNISGAYCQV